MSGSARRCPGSWTPPGSPGRWCFWCPVEVADERRGEAGALFVWDGSRSASGGRAFLEPYRIAPGARVFGGWRPRSMVLITEPGADQVEAKPRGTTRTPASRTRPRDPNWSRFKLTMSSSCRPLKVSFVETRVFSFSEPKQHDLSGLGLLLRKPVRLHVQPVRGFLGTGHSLTVVLENPVRITLLRKH